MKLTKDDIQFLIALSQEAGKAIMEVYEREDFTDVVDFKADNSPLTLADRKSHEVIAAGLKKRFPDIPVLSEEGRDISFEERAGWDAFWLVDPLDGTKEFIKRNGEFTTNIALIANRQPLYGFVHVPATGITYWNESPSSAFRMGANGMVKQIEATDFSLKASGLKVIGSRSHQSEAFKAYLEGFDSPEVVAMGSSLKFMLLAEGGAHIYPRLGPTMEWDIGAAHAILEAAGGAIEKEDGGRMEYNKEDLLNPYFVASGKQSTTEY